jgi:hypothetical protein
MEDLQHLVPIAEGGLLGRPAAEARFQLALPPAAAPMGERAPGQADLPGDSRSREAGGTQFIAQLGRLLADEPFSLAARLLSPGPGLAARSACQIQDEVARGSLASRVTRPSVMSRSDMSRSIMSRSIMSRGVASHVVGHGGHVAGRLHPSDIGRG